MPLAPPPPPLRLSSRPLLAAAVAFGSGIVLADALPRVEPALWLAVVAGGVVAAALYLVRTRRRLVTLRALVLAGAALGGTAGLGAARTAAWHALPSHHIAHVARTAWTADSARDDRAPITLWATVADVPTGSDWSIRLTATVDSAARGGRRGTVSGSVQVSLLTPDDGPSVYPALRAGDRVRLEGRLEPPPRQRNPAQMDYGAYLRRRGVYATLRVEDELGVQLLAPSPRPLDRLAAAVQRHVRTVVGRKVPTPEARAVLLALLLADRSQIDAPSLDAFRQTGLMHLLAVSGLHIGLVGGMLYVLLKPVLGRLGLRRQSVEWTRAVVTLAVLGLYVLVTGGSVSVQRAFVMAALVIVGRAGERPSDTLNALGAAALLLLALRPPALYDVGFQLSFAAVVALVTLVPLFLASVPERVLQRPLGTFVAGSLAASVAATLGTAPVLLAHFGALPLGGLLLNLTAIPLTMLALGSAIGLALVGGWFPLLADGFALLATAGAEGLLWTSRVGASGLGWATVSGYLEGAFAFVTAAFLLLALALWRRPQARHRLTLAAGAVFAVSLWTGAARGEGRATLDVLFLDVGQGDATLLRLPNGRVVLVDAGLRSPYVDEGRRTIVPHLERSGIDRLEALVLTHPDADHVGGALAVLEHVAVERIVHNGQDGASDLWQRVLHTADSLGVPVEAVAAGDTLAADPSVRLRVLGPSPALAASGAPNDASVILLVEHGQTRWLLTGDAEAAGEAALVARYPGLLRADVVKVGHHGSSTSSSPALVDAAETPDVAVVSVARRNRFGLPDPEPLARWRQAGAQVLQTSAEGAIWLRSDGRVVSRVPWR